VTQDTRETQQADVLVVGGGVAGIAASVAAAAAGARTLLLERADVLGGVATQANVHTFCGLFEPRPEDRFVYTNPGFAPWFAEGLKRAGGALEPEVHGKVGVLPTFPPRVGEHAWEVARSFPMLTVSLDSTLTGLEMGSSEGDPWIATYRGNGRTAEVRACIVIDASGDAIASELAGAELAEPASEELQHATLIFRVSGAASADLVGYGRLRLSAKVARAARTGDLPRSCESVLIRPGESPDEAYISLNLPKSDESAYSPLDPDFMQSYTDEARDFAEALIGYLANQVPGWQDCALISWPLRIGVRETRTIVGCYVMNELDITKGQHFPDAVCRSSWPIELWHGHPKPSPRSRCARSSAAAART
jgi:hypothetical protein